MKLARCRSASLREKKAHHALQSRIEGHQTQTAARKDLTLFRLALVEQHRAEFGSSHEIVGIQLQYPPEHTLMGFASGFSRCKTFPQEQERRHVVRKLLQCLVRSQLGQHNIAAAQGSVPLRDKIFERFENLRRTFAGTRLFRRALSERIGQDLVCKHRKRRVSALWLGGLIHSASVACI